MASDSEAEDYDVLQQQLARQLDDFMEQSIDDGGPARKRKKKKTPQKKDQPTVKPSAGVDSKTTAMLGKIREMTSSASHVKKRSTAMTQTNRDQAIREKVSEVLSKKRKRKIEPKVEVFEDDQVDDDFDQINDDWGCDEDDDDDFSDSPDSIPSEEPSLSGKAKQLDKFKAALGITPEYIQQKHEEERKRQEQALEDKFSRAPAKTIALKRRKTKPSRIECVVYEDPRKKKQEDAKKADVQDAPPDAWKKTPNFNLESARHDVKLLGVQGMTDRKQKKKSMVDLLVSLGAKPPKNRFYNYKDVQVRRKREIVATREKDHMDKKMGLNVKKKKEMRPKDRNDIGHVDGQIGSFKDGVQYIQKPNFAKKPRR